MNPPNTSWQKWRSNAQWPDTVSLSNTDNVSSDEHDTKHAAECVCSMLQSQGFGGEGRIFPIRVWVDQPTAPASPETEQGKDGLEWFNPTNDADLTFPCFAYYEAHLGEEPGWEICRNRGEYDCRKTAGFKVSQFACVRFLASPAKAQNEGGETPETRAFIAERKKLFHTFSDDYIAALEVMTRFERERDDARKTISAMLDALNYNNNPLDTVFAISAAQDVKDECDALRQQLEAMTAQWRNTQDGYVKVCRERDEARREAHVLRGKELNAVTEAARQGKECTDLRAQLTTAQSQVAELEKGKARMERVIEDGESLVTNLQQEIDRLSHNQP